MYVFFNLQLKLPRKSGVWKGAAFPPEIQPAIQPSNHPTISRNLAPQWNDCGSVAVGSFSFHHKQTWDSVRTTVHDSTLGGFWKHVLIRCGIGEASKPMEIWRFYI